MVYGHSEIHRKFIVRLYFWENTYFKNVQVQFINQYSMAEHLIPLSDFISFANDFIIHVQEALLHYKDIVEQLKNVTFDSTKTITY